MSARAVRRRQVVFVGSKIRQLRKERGMTQCDLAERIGVQQSDLCRMENGEYKVSLDTMFKILGVFGVEIGDFFREETAPRSPGDLDHEVLRLFRSLDPDSRNDVLDFLRYKAHRQAGTWKN